MRSVLQLAYQTTLVAACKFAFVLQMSSLQQTSLMLLVEAITTFTTMMGMVAVSGTPNAPGAKQKVTVYWSMVAKQSKVQVTAPLAQAQLTKDMLPSLTYERRLRKLAESYEVQMGERENLMENWLHTVGLVSMVQRVMKQLTETRQILGCPEQLKLLSTWQKLLHPSPFTVLLSSQTSPLVIMPSPQTEAVQVPLSRQQLLRHCVQLTFTADERFSAQVWQLEQRLVHKTHEPADSHIPLAELQTQLPPITSKVLAQLRQAPPAPQDWQLEGQGEQLAPFTQQSGMQALHLLKLPQMVQVQVAQLGEMAEQARQEADEQVQTPAVSVCPTAQEVQVFAFPEQVRQVELQTEQVPPCTKYPLAQVTQAVVPLIIWHSSQPQNILLHVAQLPAELGKMPNVVAQAQMPLVRVQVGWQVMQLVRLVQVSHVAGQEMQLGEERKVPGRQEEQLEMTPPTVVQLVQPTDRVQQSVHVLPQMQLPLVSVIPDGQERQPV